MKTIDLFLYLRTFLATHITGPGQEVFISLILIAGIAVCAIAGFYLTRLLLICVEKAIGKSSTKWDDDLISTKFISALSQLAPALIVSWLLPQCFAAANHDSVRWLEVLTYFYIIWTLVYIVNIFLDNLHNAMARRQKLRVYAVKGIFQMIKLITIGIGAIIALSLLIGKTPIAILTALGASAAILMLVFKDTILGLVASVQLTANKMVHKGDWVVVPKHDANGEVIDISLTTVKIRNWDNSVTTVPPYNLISESFRNYEPMRRSGGRRICRSIYIDINTVGFCSHNKLENLVNEGFIKPQDISSSEKSVNLGLFRKYLEQWLTDLPEVRKDMTLMVRQMEPTQAGLPLEIYFFTSLTEWIAYEHFQSEIFDHIYATLPLFGLAIFQSPTGNDFHTH